MKKSYSLALVFIVVLVMISPAFSMSSACGTENLSANGEIVIQDIRIPSTPRPRSATPLIDSYYSADMNLLEIYFNYEVGTVTINILDGMQRCIVKYTCNTETEAEVFMNLSLLPDDTYTIHIVGREYEGVGYLIL